MRIFFVGVSFIFSVFLSVSSAYSQDHKEYELNLLLIDLSGSMKINSVKETKKTRLQLGIEALKADISVERLGRYAAIYTFNSSLGLKKVVGFDHPNTINMDYILDKLTSIQRDVSQAKGLTPFAEAYCDSVDILKQEMNRRGWLPTQADLKITLATDGLENATLSSHRCYGLDGKVENENSPWAVEGSWQYKVKNMGQTGNPNIPAFPDAPAFIITNVNYLFDSFSLVFSGNALLAAQQKVSHEVNYYTSHSIDSGGYILTIDESKDIPVPGDVNGDDCVDDKDRQIVLDNYGRNGQFNIRGDLNKDRIVNEDDYDAVMKFLGTGGRCFTKPDNPRGCEYYLSSVGIEELSIISERSIIPISDIVEPPHIPYPDDCGYY